MTANNSTGPVAHHLLHRERLWPSALLLISTTLIIPTLMLVFLPINPTAGVYVAIGLFLAVVIMLLAGSPKIEVTTGELVAGRARVPVRLIGTVTAFRATDATLQRGRLLDARAWLLIRGWVSPVVKVELTDESDPTPYWILSTRRPDALVAAIAVAKATAGR